MGLLGLPPKRSPSCGWNRRRSVERSAGYTMSSVLNQFGVSNSAN